MHLNKAGWQICPASENGLNLGLPVAWVPRTQVSGKEVFGASPIPGAPSKHEVLVPRNTNFGKMR